MASHSPSPTVVSFLSTILTSVRSQGPATKRTIDQFLFFFRVSILQIISSSTCNMTVLIFLDHRSPLLINFLTCFLLTFGALKRYIEQSQEQKSDRVVNGACGIEKEKCKGTNFWYRGVWVMYKKKKAKRTWYDRNGKRGEIARSHPFKSNDWEKAKREKIYKTTCLLIKQTNRRNAAERVPRKPEKLERALTRSYTRSRWHPPPPSRRCRW